MWQDISNGFMMEFSDLTDVASVTRLLTRSLFSCLLGGLIGYERESSGKDAGLRTHMLVCLGTSIFVAIPDLALFPDDSVSRIIQGVAAGIGFVGAGAILKHEHENKVEGMTSAASIWFTAAVGIAIGLGKEASAFIATLLALVILALLPKVKKAN